MGKNLVWLALSGGEVTLVKYMDTLLLEGKKKCKNLRVISFTTNGLIPKKAISLAKKIQEIGYEPIVTISLDGDEELHDRVRGVKGNYKKCISLFNSLKKMGVNVNYGITVNGENKEYIYKNYYSMRHSMKAITFVHDGGIYKKTNDTNVKNIIDSMKYICKKYSIDTISEIIEFIHIKVSVFYLNANQSTNLIPCEVINSSVHIMEDGEVRPCMYLESLGNIKENDIREMIFSEKANNIKKQIKEDKCPHCWMNCYSPYSIMQHPIKSIRYLFKSIKQ
jgi:sulfatase maturation enzyme AslB (radical SAM superfamily)